LFSVVAGVAGPQSINRNPFLYEKDNCHQHAAYSGVLPRFAIIDLGLYGPSLTCEFPACRLPMLPMAGVL
jgi:hypothetical protein